MKRRYLSIFHKGLIDMHLNTATNTNTNAQIQNDLDRAIKLVQKHDPVGYLPGLLVTKRARLGYFAGE